MRYDLRQGLQRRNYLIATLLFSMRLFAVYRSVQFYCNVESISSRGSIGDYMLCLFRGMAIIQHGSMEEKVSVPIEWLIVCGFCLYITAAYPAQGISVQGQQVFLRTDMLMNMDWDLLGVVNPILDGATGIRLQDGASCDILLPFDLYRYRFTSAEWNRLEQSNIWLQVTNYPTRKIVRVNIGEE